MELGEWLTFRSSEVVHIFQDLFKKAL